MLNPGALLRSAESRVLWLLDPGSGRFEQVPMSGGATFGVLDLPSCQFRVLRAADGVEVEINRRQVLR